MAKAFSVLVNIGGKVNPSLAASVNLTKTKVLSLEGMLTGVGARIAAPFIAAQKTIAATTLHLEKMQRVGRNLSLGVTMPTAWIGANWIKQAAGFEGERVGGTIDRIGKSNPALLKIGVGLATAAAAAGPLLFALGAVGRLALAPFRLLSKAVRLLLWPLRAVTSAAVLMRGALMFTLPGAIVASLATAGMFIYNNWKNLPTFFDSFKQSLMKNLGPGAEGNGQWLIDKAREAYTWFSDLTKALSVDTWHGWGTAAGEAVAGIVTQLSGLVTQATPIVNEIIAKWRAADWAGLGAAIGSAIWQGIKSNMGSLLSFLWNGPAGGNPFGNALTGMKNSPGGVATAPAGGAAPSTVPARALGGPVSFGRPYLVGERGPELFVPGMSGRIETNDTLRRLTADGAAIEATRERAAMSGSRGPTTITNHWTINGADDPREVVRQIDSRFGELVRQLEAEQRGMLSD